MLPDRAVVAAAALGDLDGVAVGVEGGHDSFPGFIVRGFVKGHALGLEMLVEGIEVVGT